MSSFKFVQKIMKDFLTIFASIIIILTLLRQLYDPNIAFDLKSIYIIMAFSIISALMGFIIYFPNDSSEKQMRIRIAVHFFSLEILLIVLASIFGIVESTKDVIVLALQIAAIYIIVRLLSWQNDKKEAKRMNEKLKELKNNRNPL